MISSNNILTEYISSNNVNDICIKVISSNNILT